MSGHRSFKELSNKLRSTPEGRAATRCARQNLGILLRLSQIREMRGMTQTDLADALQVSQPNVSRIENAADLNVSSLRTYTEGLGSTLQISVVFPDTTIPLEGIDIEGVDSGNGVGGGSDASAHPNARQVIPDPLAAR